MSGQESHYRELIRLLFPEELFDYFTVVNIKEEDRDVHVYLMRLIINPTLIKMKNSHQRVFTMIWLSRTFPSVRRHCCGT